MATLYEDLFDIEKRPGAGLGLWTKAVKRQLDRVRAANYRHRLHHTPNEEEKQEDPDAEPTLQAEVYFLCLGIRRILLFHDLFEKKTSDPRLTEARAEFEAAAPNAKRFRDFFEHLGEYLLDTPSKHVKFPGRAAPRLQSYWDCDNVLVVMGPHDMDVTLAAVAAIELGEASGAVWDEHMKRSRAEQSTLPPPDDGVPRVIELTFGRSAIIGTPESPPEVTSGVLLAVRLREADREELPNENWRTTAGQGFADPN